MTGHERGPIFAQWRRAAVMWATVGVLLAPAGGCVIIPQFYRLDPLKDAARVAPSRRSGAPSILLDAESGAAVADAKIVLVIERLPAYLPDSRSNRTLSPRVAVEAFARLPRLSYRYYEIYFFPWFALGSLYSPSGMYIFRRGYLPEEYRPDDDGTYPHVVELRRCDEATSREEMMKLAVQGVPESWKSHVQRQLKRRLR